MRWLTLAAGRRAKFAVLASAVAALASLAPLSAKFEDAQEAGADRKRPRRHQRPPADRDATSTTRSETRARRAPSRRKSRARPRRRRLLATVALSALAIGPMLWELAGDTGRWVG